ncbi:MAG: hypothetical protein KUF82_20860, partial [Candidatus Thiodiazotropha sp. (ex Ctena orbiculata)]|nr:hypothetical protein [Candidatus Thiodiazotropha taylori]
LIGTREKKDLVLSVIKQQRTGLPKGFFWPPNDFVYLWLIVSIHMPNYLEHMWFWYLSSFF